MVKTTIIALRVTVVTLLLTGVAYPLVMTGISQLIFPHQANGSLVRNDKGEVVGSSLIAQGFSNPAYFQPRPSAAGNGYDCTSSSGSNWGTTSAKLRERLTSDTTRLKAENPDAQGPIPDDLVTASGSGLDPHITPAGALWQVERVAKARHLSPNQVRKLVEEQTDGRMLGFIGEERVNVLLLNRALDKLSPLPGKP